MHNIAGTDPNIHSIIQRLHHQPMNELLSFRDALVPFIQHDGYIERHVQEILLQCFGDIGFSSRIDILTDAFRNQDPPGVVTTSVHQLGNRDDCNVVRESIRLR